MMTNLFDQFMSPTYMGVPLVVLALAFPLVLFPVPSSRWVQNRLLTVQNWLLGRFTNQLLTPVNLGGHKWALLLTSLMAFLVSLNALGLLPYTFTPSTQISISLGFAAPLWATTVFIGMKERPTHALGHLLPEGTPVLLIPLLVLIETISLLIRPFALAVRLTANITAGHLLIQLIATAVFLLIPLLPPVAILAAIILVLLCILEFAVAIIQAYVYVLLVALYLQENV